MNNETGIENLDQKFTPFNSLKSLVYADHYEAILRKDFLPPVTVEMDPSFRCNQNCLWCIVKRYFQDETILMPRELMRRLITEFADHGVKAIVFIGGGEPLLHEDIPAVCRFVRERGMQCSMVTNGALLDREKGSIVADTCTYIRISLDAGTPQTYARLHQAPEAAFGHIIEQIRHMASVNKGGLKIGVGFLIHPDNIGENVTAAGLVRDAGAGYIQFRPAYMMGVVDRQMKEKRDAVREEIAKAEALSTPSFRVISAFKKVEPHLKGKWTFEKCLASPLKAVVGATGDVYICCERRGEVTLGNVKERPFFEVWNSPEHHRVVDNVRISSCRKLCALAGYNEIIENVFVRDRMHRNFL